MNKNESIDTKLSLPQELGSSAFAAVSALPGFFLGGAIGMEYADRFGKYLKTTTELSYDSVRLLEVGIFATGGLGGAALTGLAVGLGAMGACRLYNKVTR